MRNRIPSCGNLVHESSISEKLNSGLAKHRWAVGIYPHHLLAITLTLFQPNGGGGGKFVLRVPFMMEKIGKWIFPLKSGFSIGYSIGPKISANLGFGIGPKPKN